MQWAALVTWILTAGFGFILLFTWLARGGMRQKAEPGTRIRPPLILGHFLLAAGGLIVWIVYVIDKKNALAWVAFAVLAVVALLGWTMFAIWWQRRRAREGAAVTVAETAGGASSGSAPAEQSFPVPVVAVHGLLAVTTVVLVLLSALKIGLSGGGGGGEYGLW